jgi:hypothetical protein
MKNNSTVVQWNHLQYIDQVRVMDKINELIESQTDETMRTALTAALIELEIWSNTPLDMVNALVHDEPLEEDEEEVEKTWIH